MPKQTSETKPIITPNKAWYIKQYKEKYLHFPTSDKIKSFFNNKNNDYLYLYGAYNRTNSLVTFGYYIDINIIDTICTTFKIRDSINNIEAIYSFGYYEKEYKDDTNRLTKVGNSPFGMHYKYKYFTSGGSFLSKDGEYRVGLIKITNLAMLAKTPILSNIFNDITEYLSKKLIDRKMLLYKEFFYPTEEQKTIETELEYYSYTIQKELFSIAWFNDMFNEHLSIVENHINEKYKSIMFKYKKEDTVYFNILMKKYGHDYMHKFRYISNHIFLSNIVNSGKETATKVGQKIIPLSISDAQNPFDLKYKPWREYLVSTFLSNFVVNNISPGFFITNSWFYIKNSRKGLFDNDIQYERMARSELAIQITELLSRAQIFTHENISQTHRLTKQISKKTLNSWISNKFKNLSNKIQDPIDYAKEEIIMSNVALCFITEYVGRTFMDALVLTKSSTYYNDLIGNPFTPKGFPLFSKYIFDLCYNLYCMNYRAGIMHGDLHLNNATLNPLTYRKIRNIKEINKPTVLYVLGDEESQQYIFPTNGYNTCIIDFSRCIILPEKIDQLNDNSLPKSHNIMKNIKQFHEDQVQQLWKLYLFHTSDNVTNKDELCIIFKNHFEAVFKILSITDLYRFTRNLSLIFDIKDKNFVIPHNKCVDLINKINSISQKFLTVEMNKLIADRNYEKNILEGDWPIYTVIKECFSDFLITTTPINNIIDVYNIDNELKYSLDKYDNFPPLIGDPKYIKNGRIKSIESAKNFVKGRRLFEKEKDKGMKIVNYIATRQKQKHL